MVNLSPTPNDDFLEACEAGDLLNLGSLDLNAIHDASIKRLGLQEAAKNGHVDTLRFLLEVEPPIEVDSYTANYAAWGNLEVYRLLHRKYPDIIDWWFGEVGNIVHLAIRTHKFDLLEYVLENGADPGRTSECCRYGDTFTPIEDAVLAATPEFARLLLAHGATSRQTVALRIATHLGRLDMVRCLLDAGAVVNYICDPTHPKFVSWKVYGSALHNAAAFGHTEIARILLENGAVVALQNTAGKTALDEARAAGHEATAELIQLYSIQ